MTLATLGRRIDRLERGSDPPCPTCRDWPGNLFALLSDNDPWLREDGSRECPGCGRTPPLDLATDRLLIGPNESLDTE